MIEAMHLWLFFLFVFGIVIVPGMDMTVVLANALGGGRRDGLLATFGVMAGGVCHVVVGALGIGLVAFFLGLPLVIPIAVLVFLGSFIPIVGAVITGALAVVVALVYNGWVAAIVMLVFWQRLPADLDEITRDFALDRQRLKRQILQPGLLPAWGIGFLLAVLLSLGDFPLANALSGERAMLSPSLLTGIATQRSPIYLALVGPLLALTGWLCHLILKRLDRRVQKRAPLGRTGLGLNITARKA